MEVPGMITRSMFTSREGDTIPQLGSFLVDHRTPLAQRWGGWFVTGNHGAPPYGGLSHMGNVTTTLKGTADIASTSNEVLIEWLNSDAAARAYLSRESDIAALMVFDHQMHAINLLTRLNWETRVAADGGVPDFAAGTLRDLVDETVDYFLFVGEAPPPARLTPSAGFAQRFAARAPRDRHGRSLRDLDLEHRLLRYPCSYMIDSQAFAALPQAARDAIYARMSAILSGRDAGAKYAHLSPEDRRAIAEILRATKSDAPF